MSWNYRIVKSADPDGTEVWAVHEVYYDSEGKPEAWTERPSHPLGETWNELHRDFTHYQEAFTKRALDVTSGKAVELTLTGREKVKR